ncbi:MAG: hypothetical protein HKP40_09645 [Litoreibacter sp.]|nr:hypothetical protein [Litoreibacter sp.]
MKLTKINANRGPMTQFASRAEVVVNECSPLTIEPVGHEMVRAEIGGANSERSRDFAQKAASGAILPGDHGISFQEVEQWQIRRPNSK